MLFIRRIGAEKEGVNNGEPLKAALARTIIDWFDPSRKEGKSSFPEDVVYFQTVDDKKLIKVINRKRTEYNCGFNGDKEMSNGNLGKNVRFGLFVEGFEFRDGVPYNCLSDSSLVNIESVNVKPVEVTDDPNDVVFKNLKLTPTSFSNFVKSKFGDINLNKANLLEGEQVNSKLGGLFKVKIEEESKKVGNESRNNIYGQITEEFFDSSPTQGISSESGYSHVVFTNDEDCMLVKVSEGLELETHIIKPDESWSHPHGNPLVRFRDSQNMRPFLASIDSRSLFEAKGMPDSSRTDFLYLARGNISNYINDGFPLFAVIDFNNINEVNPSISRLHDGWSILHGYDGKSKKYMEGLMTKAGVDYAVTLRMQMEGLITKMGTDFGLTKRARSLGDKFYGKD